MKLTKKLFFIILFIGFFLRIYNVANIPASLHVDEVSYGYNAYSILTTGKDEYGVPFPLFFKATGEYKSAVPVYSMVPFIYLFGLNEFSIRFYSVIYGVLGIFAIYLLTKELFADHAQKETIALFTMFLLAISPWDIQFSRIAWDITPFLFFTTFGAYLILKSEKIPKLLPYAIMACVLALYSYFVAWVFIPFFGLLFFIVYFKQFLQHKKETVISLLILIIMLIPIFQNTFSPHGLIRWQQISIFSNPPQNEAIVTHILVNYVRHFSLDFLFLKGDSGMPGQPNTYDSVRGMGELYLFELPLLFLGIYRIWKIKTKTRFILFFWLILYPLGSMFTDRESPLARRSITGVIPFQIFSAYGLFYFLAMVEKMKKGKSVVITLTALVIVFSFVYYLYLYFVTYPKYSADYYGFQYGSKQIVNYFANHESSYDDLVMSPYIFSPYIYFKFYAPTDCRKCETGFPNELYNPQRKQLFALPPYYTTSHTEFTYIPISYIYYPNGSLAFVLTQIKGNN